MSGYCTQYLCDGDCGKRHAGSYGEGPTPKPMLLTNKEHQEMSCCPHGIHWDNGCGACVPPRGTTIRTVSEKRPPGRPVLPDADRLKVGTIRLTQAQWDKLAALGGVEWLRKKIDAAKLPNKEKQ